jgi:hypothetical protein
MNNQYPKKTPFMKPSLWTVSIMAFLYLLISLMLGFDPEYWYGATQILFVILELIGAVVFVICRIDLDADFVKEFEKNNR